MFVLITVAHGVALKSNQNPKVGSHITQVAV